MGVKIVMKVSKCTKRNPLESEGQQDGSATVRGETSAEDSVGREQETLLFLGCGC